MRCVVCGLEGAAPVALVKSIFTDDHTEWRTRIEWVPAPPRGAACSPDCATLVALLPLAVTPDDKALAAWEWRQRRATRRGESFNEPPPRSNVERDLAALLALRAANVPDGAQP